MKLRRIVEVSHEIEAGMVTYKGLPGPVLSDFLSREASRGFHCVPAPFRGLGSFPVRAYAIVEEG